MLAGLATYEKLVPGELVQCLGKPIKIIAKPPTDDESFPEFGLIENLQPGVIFNVWLVEKDGKPALAVVDDDTAVGRKAIEEKLHHRINAVEYLKPYKSDAISLMYIVKELDALELTDEASKYRDIATVWIMSNRVSGLDETIYLSSLFGGDLQSICDSTARSFNEGRLDWLEFGNSAAKITRIQQPDFHHLTRSEQNPLIAKTFANLNQRAQDLEEHKAT